MSAFLPVLGWMFFLVVVGWMVVLAVDAAASLLGDECPDWLK